MPDVRRDAARAHFRLGDTGHAVAEIGDRLARLGLLASTGTEQFDQGLDRAVRAFQQQRGLTVDGVVGPTTYRILDEARWRLGDRLLTHIPGNVMSGDDVVALQKRLLDLGFKVGRVDGLFGHTTEQGVRDFQRNVGIPPDGTCGPATLKALGRLAPMVRGGQPNAMRSEERIRNAGPQLTGKVV
ncbi:MAG: peptidoglycan-binding protein, partial [Actinomycetes bacterium]